MPRPDEESNTINRVLKAWGLPPLDHPEVLPRMGYLIDDHRHFTSLLKACEPTLRRDMYEALSPHLRFRPKPLEEYISAAKDYAEAAQLPTIEPDGSLKPFSPPVIEEAKPPCGMTLTCEDEECGDYELWVVCMKCDKEAIFWGDNRSHAIRKMRNAGWTFDDDSINRDHRCPECADKEE